MPMRARRVFMHSRTLLLRGGRAADGEGGESAREPCTMAQTIGPAVSYLIIAEWVCSCL